MASGCCPKCGSRLYPNDDEPMKLVGVCGYCTSWNPKYKAAYQAAKEKQAKSKKKGYK